MIPSMRETYKSPMATSLELIIILILIIIITIFIAVIIINIITVIITITMTIVIIIATFIIKSPYVSKINHFEFVGLTQPPHNQFTL